MKITESSIASAFGTNNNEVIGDNAGGKGVSGGTDSISGLNILKRKLAKFSISRSKNLAKSKNPKSRNLVNSSNSKATKEPKLLISKAKEAFN